MACLFNKTESVIVIKFFFSPNKSLFFLSIQFQTCSSHNLHAATFNVFLKSTAFLGSFTVSLVTVGVCLPCYPEDEQILFICG